MQILVFINQKESLKAGFEAPSSTELFELPVSAIPETVRKVVAEGYDFQRKRLLINGKPITLVKPLTQEKVLAAIQALYEEWLKSLDE